ncbi:MAG TPA: stress response translation initiation inhibitor YciH [Nitrososphaeraceae archaeon]
MSNSIDENSMSEILRELDKETTRIIISKQIRGKYKKISTVIIGIASKLKDSEITKITSELKSKIGTGGTYKDGQIILQGDHRDLVKQLLVKRGFNEESIEVL